MKTYKSHKTVQAAKILHGANLPATGAAVLQLADSAGTVTVSHEWLRKNGEVAQLIGGYFVRYADGYTSWSPAEAFEEGYSEVSEADVTLTAWPAVKDATQADSWEAHEQRQAALQTRAAALTAALQIASMAGPDARNSVDDVLDDAAKLLAYLSGEGRDSL